MKKWHLYESFKNGVNTGGRIQYVCLFGIIGAFVLFLACINFMNLSTARSINRAKEVGIRKTAGSLRRQIIVQFFLESLLYVLIAFVICLMLTAVFLPLFNSISGKVVTVPWAAPSFWISGFLFCMITGLLAGVYPALYLSSFKPGKVLKGVFRAGGFAVVQRKILVVVQFTISIVLIIGTGVVFRQIQFAKNRPIGYNRNGLVAVEIPKPDLHTHFDAVKSQLINTGAITELAESESQITGVSSSTTGIDWPGKEPGLGSEFPIAGVGYDFGRTVGWEFVTGRDFSRDFLTDSAAMVVNESAVKYMNLKNPVGTIIRADGDPVKIIGVIKDMVMESPYAPVRPSLYYLNTNARDFYLLAKINPKSSANAALRQIEKMYKKYLPGEPFHYKFVDEEYNQKFGDEERMGKLGGAFAILAIFISCLGLFGMTSFMTEQRTKEIGVRKTLGASMVNLWVLLSKDFVRLVLFSVVLAWPVALYCMHEWLSRYEYRTRIPWWIFAASGLTALIITFLTISYQTLRAASANPAKSLRTE